MKLNMSKKELIIIILILFIQTIVFVIAGINKSYLHIDEAFSLGLTNYDVVKISNREDFFNKWHNKEYYEDYLIINEDEKCDFSPVYINQKNDVHPPFYYLLLRIAMQFHVGKFSKWSGIVLNIFIYIFITIFMYLITKKLLENEDDYREKALFLSFVSSITLASITSAIYIRMYALSTLNVLITTYLHMKLLEGKKERNDILFLAIGISALIGSLTHYYYLFYLAMLFIMFVITFAIKKDYKKLIKYILSMVIAGIASVVIFPYSIKHMFFGYRGQGAISNLSQISKFMKSIFKYIFKINIYEFNNLLFVILIAMIIICIYKKIKKLPVIRNKNKYIKYMILPSLFYFILVAISSPWIELRYVMPICPIIFLIVMFYLKEFLENIISKRNLKILFIVIFISMIITPSITNKFSKNKIKIEVLYSDKKEIVRKFDNEFNVPTLYMAKAKNVRFLDDILLFTKIKESYVAEGIECSEENIKNIMKDKDVSNGMIVFINEGQNNKEILKVIQNAMNLKNTEHIKRMNACDIYYIK